MRQGSMYGLQGDTVYILGSVLVALSAYPQGVNELGVYRSILRQYLYGLSISPENSS